MKKIVWLFSIIVLASGICLAQTSGFSYPGKSSNGGSPANGTYQFECKLFDDAAVENQIGSLPPSIEIPTNAPRASRF